MNPAGVLLVATIAFWAGRLSHYRTLRGLDDQLEYQRQHVDGADQAINISRRGWRSSLERTRRQRELAR